MDLFDGVATDHLGATLGVANVHPEKCLDDGMKNAARELALV